MPSKNSIKTYVVDGIYHVYNRGVAKQPIFLQDKDYLVFLSRLSEILTDPKNQSKSRKVKLSEETDRRNHSGKIKLLGYCLMPNHYHLLIQQTDPDSMTNFMKTLFTSYSMYFNRTHDRVGGVFQGRYKASLVDTDEYLMHLSRYIHLNPLKLEGGVESYDYSSFRYYRDTAANAPKWLNREAVLDLFSNSADYANFVRNTKIDSTEYLPTEVTNDY